MTIKSRINNKIEAALLLMGIRAEYENKQEEYLEYCKKIRKEINKNSGYYNNKN